MNLAHFPPEMRMGCALLPEPGEYGGLGGGFGRPLVGHTD